MNCASDGRALRSLDNLHGQAAPLDHLVYAAPDLADGIERVETLLGVASTPGGAHPGLGSRNALVGLGGTSYLEIIGPDPEQPDPERPRAFGLDDLVEARLVTWAVRPPTGQTIDEYCAQLGDFGLEFGEPHAMTRRTPDGELLAWCLARPKGSAVQRFSGATPFVIDWGSTPHPASRLSQGIALREVIAEHPRPAELQEALAAMHVSCAVRAAEEAGLCAVLRAADGSAVGLR